MTWMSIQDGHSLDIIKKVMRQKKTLLLLLPFLD